ncbi:M15 family metallopeptidase [Bacillus taeanensis]|uniref:D-alanyl-D-alanine carboxypeptidase family protein n=1 Tax=Bacillus taeanensis TaxID=273032 RepID=A0A366Y260_9BACI|nr:M15 family metallopeptidase [Bacillus taeanensis]RBW71079.1 D-alanyl-D-alanine carboxypeptidase family protein [Bacillus taeanensis]
MKLFKKMSIGVIALAALTACTPTVNQVEDHEQTVKNPSEETADHLQENNDENKKDSDQAAKNNNEEKKKLPTLAETITKGENGKDVVTNPNDILVVANKERRLPSDYIPDDLAEPNVPFTFEEDVPKKLMRKEAAAALESLFNQAEKENIHILAQSGYRSYETQQAIFAYNAKRYGSEEEANKVSAYPGESEHQTGLSMDITSSSAEYQLVEAFGETKEGRWVAENAHKFGYIVRYQKGKEQITGYQYEPWHLRYVGIEAASHIYKQNMTLEEYLQ